MIGERPIHELAAALAKAQAEIKHAEKSAENPAFKRDGKALKYATLADVWDACRGPLTANGLSVVQSPARTDHGVSVTTVLMHTSGQYLDSTLEVPVGGGTAQSFGSAITYARRYALAAIVGIAPDEDDDGNAASVPEPRGGGYRNGSSQRRTEPREQPQRDPDAPFEAKPDPHVTNLEQLRADANRLSGRLKKHLRITTREMRREARVSIDGAMSGEHLVIFNRWATARLRDFEDAGPDDDMPEFMQASPHSGLNGEADD